MAEEPSKYASNQFEVVTRGRFSLMSEILADTSPRLNNAVLLNPDFTEAKTRLDAVMLAWDAAETRTANAEALLPCCTIVLDTKMESLTHKPDAETNSILEGWDNIIRGQVAYQGSVYTYLLPQGRETLTVGTMETRLDALRNFAARLATQTTKPALVELGLGVAEFYEQARQMRIDQTTAKSSIDDARAAQEPVRVDAAGELFFMVGLGMTIWSETPLMVDTLFSVALLRGTPQALPEAPADTTWAPATRTLTTTAMPESASRLAAWREGPGGMPEQLAIGEPGALEVMIPAGITFDVGDHYQLWLQGVNSQGQSASGPKQNWTAT